MYGTSYCGFCRRAEELLKRQGIAFEYVDVTNDPKMRTWLVERAHGRRTVPVILFGQDVIGGYQELAALKATGELDRRLAAATPSNDNADAGPVRSLTKPPRAA